MAIKAVNKKKKYVIVRTYSAGVFAGFLEARNGKEVTLSNARRLWYWAGANTLSDLAMSGTLKPEQCKFPVPVASIDLTEAIEIIDTTTQAQNSIQGVRIW